MRAQFSRCAPALIPLREYIQRTLYAEHGGYFTAEAAPILTHGDPIALSTLRDRDEYEGRVAAAYRAFPHGWMTPVELFSPFLSNAIANRVATAAPPNQSLAVIEIGGGRGTLAVDVLQCLRSRHPDVYERVTYHLVEVSSVLATMQACALAKSITEGKAVVYTRHAVDWIRECQIEEQHCHVIATEVLDNLPHDLLRCSGGEFSQAFVSNETRDGSFNIEWSPCVDVQTLDAGQDFGLLSPDGLGHSTSASFLTSLRSAFEIVIDRGVSHVWCPTISHQILKAISERIPSASLTIADFTSFPGSLPHANGPVIQRVERGVAAVYDSIEDAPFGRVDIMFPTNFAQFERAHHRTRARSGQKSKTSILAQHQFFREFASQEDRAGSTCQDGFNPILSDFANVSFMLADPISP